MKIFHSNVPDFILVRELHKKSVKRWIYFGTDNAVLRKLERIFGLSAVQVDYGERLYRLSKIKRDEFVLWVDQIANSFQGRKEWLFSVSAVKNTYTSNLFLYICYLFLLEDYIHEGKQIDLIFVDSPALAAVLKDSFPDFVVTAPINSWLRLCFYFKTFTKSILRFGKYLLEFGHKFICAKIILRNRGRQLLQGKNNLVFIRNFISGQFCDTQNDIVENHYFPGLYNYLEEKSYMPVFLPVAILTSSYRCLYQNVFKSKKVVIFPEEFLKLEDYLYVFWAPLRALTLKLSPPPYGQYQLGPLLKEDYYSNVTESGFLYATLLSCLGNRFKECGVAPSGIINWMENQAFEKGLIKGLKESFPNIQVIGSQPYFSPGNYFSTISAHQEKQSGVFPEKILVLGPAGKEWATKFIKDASVGYSPAFRYASMISGPLVNNQANNLLVLLSIRLESSIHMMRMLLKIEPHLESFDRIMVKLHPAGDNRDRLIKILGRNLPQRFEFIDGKLEQYIDQASIGFCGVTGTAVELVMRGIPVIVAGDPHALTMDYLSCREDLDIWRFCFSCEQVIKALGHFRMLRKEESQHLLQKAYKFRNVFIAPPSEKYWENYLFETKCV